MRSKFEKAVRKSRSGKGRTYLPRVLTSRRLDSNHACLLPSFSFFLPALPFPYFARSSSFCRATRFAFRLSGTSALFQSFSIGFFTSSAVELPFSFSIFPGSRKRTNKITSRSPFPAGPHLPRPFVDLAYTLCFSFTASYDLT